MCRTPVGRERHVSDSTLRQITQLSKLSFSELQARWRSLLGTEPPAYHRRFLVKRLAYRIQELAYGGPPETTSPASGGLRGPSPDLMTPAARRAEVAAILAAGFLRLRLKQAKKREIPLDVLPRPSDECLESQSRRRDTREVRASPDRSRGRTGCRRPSPRSAGEI